MYNTTSFFWYDLETFGLDPSYDRIAQFAGQRTDLSLNPIGDPVIMYCRLSADYLPDPMSCLVTGIVPQEVKKKGICESEFIEEINKLFSVPGTCVAGFNTLQFDDEFIRNALYRNFLDPYEREWKNGCSRWDIIDLVRATHDLRPDGICWPHKENGNPSFKLTDLTDANNIEQIGAHDAMVDVNATIAVAKLIKQKQPKLFDYYFSLRNKAEVKDRLKLQALPDPMLYTCAKFTNPNGCTSMIVPISPKVEQDNRILCFDLSKDPSTLLCSTSENVMQSPGLLSVAVNKSPFIAPLTSLKPEDYKRLGIDYALCMSHYKAIMDSRTSLIVKLRDVNQEEFKSPDDVDYKIYNGFFTDYDKSLFKVIRSTPAEQRVTLNLQFQDPRCSEMLKRHVCRNYPEKLTSEQTEQWKQFAASRLLSPPGNPINDIFFVERKIDEKLEDPQLDEKAKSVLNNLKEYVVSLKKYVGIKNPS